MVWKGTGPVLDDRGSIGSEPFANSEWAYYTPPSSVQRLAAPQRNDGRIFHLILAPSDLCGRRNVIKPREALPFPSSTAISIFA
jgi:hypothetical protein